MVEIKLGKVVGTGGGSGNLFAFEIREDGHLYVVSEDDNANVENFFIDTNGHLKYKIFGSERNTIDLGLVVGDGSIDGILTVNGGTMTGKLVANNNSDNEQQVRNIIFSSTVPTTVEDGCIVMVYE